MTETTPIKYTANYLFINYFCEHINVDLSNIVMLHLDTDDWDELTKYDAEFGYMDESSSDEFEDY